MTLGVLRNRFQAALETLLLTLITALAIVVIVGVVFRKAGAALVWYDEVASVLLAWLTYYGASFAALKRAHIGFPKIVESVGPRSRLVLAVVRELIVIGFFVLVAWAGWQVLQILQGINLTSLPSVPARLTQSVIPISAVLFIVAEGLACAEDWRGLTERAETSE